MNLTARDAAVVWHPFTQHGNGSVPLEAASAQGSYIYDTSGKRYIDLISSWWVNVHGHCHPEITEAIARQAATLDHVLFAGTTHEPAVRLAEELTGLLDHPAARVFYTDDGSTSVEVALKMALQFWKNQGSPRSKIAALKGAYHGDTFGSMSVGRSSGFFEAFSSSLFDVDFIDVPECWEGFRPVEDEERILALFDERASREDLAALIVEPLVLGAAGMRFYSESFLQGLFRIARKYGILIIADEVMTGFGRTGPLLATGREGLKPDIVCLSKGITGGSLPLGATLVAPVIFDAFLGGTFEKALAHGHSYTANPIICAAALASIEIFKRSETEIQRKKLHGFLQEHFLSMCRQSSKLEKPRLIGCIAAADIKGVGSVYGSGQSRGLELAFREKGLILRPIGKTIYLLPPYCLSEQDIASGCDAIASVLED